MTETGRRVARLQARLLGGMELRYGDRLVPESAFRRRHGLALLLWLLVEPAHRLNTEAVIECFWPDQEPHAGAVSLRAVLSSMRAAVGGSAAPLVVRLDAALALHHELEIDLDVRQFERAAAAALASSDPAAIQSALAWYRGPLLPAFGYEDWLHNRREEVERLRARLLTALASIQTTTDPAAAEDSLRALLAADPLNEEAAQTLMRLLGARGKRAEALRVYQGLATALERDLEVAPAPETEALRAALLTEMPPPPAPVAPRAAEPASPPPSKACPGNLPARVSSFVGRQWEQLEVRRLLQSTRLLTLSGTGGCGKTRLALEVAADVAPDYPGGAWLVELAGLTNPGLIGEALAGALGLQETPHQSLLAGVIARLAPSPALLVLDNCEHLLEACAEIATALLRSCGQLRILTTSREGLRIAGELTWRVPSLSLPAGGGQEDASPSPAQVARSEAAQLLLERARAVRPGFSLTDANAPLIAGICRRLDGIPLAIELAAARLASLSVEQVASRLDASFQLLTQGSRTALPRHRTLQAALDWGYRLLTEQEQALLRQLSVFSGGWTLEAAETVCAGADMAPDSIVDLLSNLVAKSLVQVADQEGHSRYWLLETVRQYARDLLERSGDAPLRRDLHLAWCVGLAEQAEPGLKGGQQPTWLARLEAEHDNLRAALAWGLAAQQPDDEAAPARSRRSYRLAGKLGRFWLMRGYLSEGRRWLAEARTRESDVPFPERCEVLDAAGYLAASQGDYPQAVALHEQSLELRRTAGDTRDLVEALLGLGNVAREQADYPRAVALYEESLTLARANDDAERMRGALNGLGNVANEQADFPRAIALYEEAVALARRTGDRQALARLLNNLGNVAQNQGDFARSVVLLEQSLALKRELGDRRGISTSLGNLGNATRMLGDHTRAIALYEESLSIDRDLGNRSGISNVLSNLGDLHFGAGDHRQAAARYREALALHAQLGDRRGLAWDLRGLAILAAAHLGADPDDGDSTGNAKRERLVRLLSAVDALHAAIAVPVLAEGRTSFEQCVAEQRQSLSDALFEEAWAAGRTLDVAVAIDDALFLTLLPCLQHGY